MRFLALRWLFFGSGKALYEDPDNSSSWQRCLREIVFLFTILVRHTSEFLWRQLVEHVGSKFLACTLSDQLTLVKSFLQSAQNFFCYSGFAYNNQSPRMHWLSVETFFFSATPRPKNLFQVKNIACRPIDHQKGSNDNKRENNFEEQLQPKIPKIESIKLEEKTGSNSNKLPRKSTSFDHYIHRGKKLTR